MGGLRTCGCRIFECRTALSKIFLFARSAFSFGFFCLNRITLSFFFRKKFFFHFLPNSFLAISAELFFLAVSAELFFLAFSAELFSCDFCRTLLSCVFLQKTLFYFQKNNFFNIASNARAFNGFWAVSNVTNRLIPRKIPFFSYELSFIITFST